MMRNATWLIALLAVILPAQSAKKNSWDHFRERNYEQALEGLTQDNKLYPKVAAIIDGMGWCEFFLNRHDKAERHFRDALSVDAQYKWSKQGLELIAAARKAPADAAQALLAAGNFREARAAFAAAHESRLPPSTLAELSSGEGWSLYWQALYDDAIRCFQRAAREHSEHVDAQRGMAYCLYAKGQWTDAIAPLKHLLRAAPKDVDAQLVLGWCHYWRKQYNDASAAFANAAQLQPEAGNPRTGLGWCLERQSQSDAAYAHFFWSLQREPSALGADLLALIAQRPQWRGLRTAAALGWLANDNPTYALSALDLSTVDAPRGDELLVAAVACLRLQDLAQARKHFEAAKLAGATPLDFGLRKTNGTRAPSATSLAHVEGWILLAEGRAADAARAFLQCAAENAGQVEALLGRGWAAFSDNPLTAEGHFREALALLPECADAQTGLSRVREWRLAEYETAKTLLLSDANAALTACEKIVAASDGRFPATEQHRLHVLRANALKALGRRDEAKAALRQAVDLQPEAGEAHHALLCMALEDNRVMDARSHAEAARRDKTYENNAQVLVTIAKAKASEKRQEEALHDFEAAVASAPFDAPILAAFAEFEHAANRVVEARILLERACYVDPSIAETAAISRIAAANAEYEKLNAAQAWGWFGRAEYAKAIAAFEKALKVDALAPDLRRGLGLSLLRCGKLREASEHLEKHCASTLKEGIREETWGMLSSMLSEWGWAHYYAGQFADAIRVFTRLVTLHAGTAKPFADPHAALGWCFLKQGKTDQAKRAFLDAILIYPRHELALQGLEALLEAGKKGGQ